MHNGEQSLKSSRSIHADLVAILLTPIGLGRVHSTVDRVYALYVQRVKGSVICLPWKGLGNARSLALSELLPDVSQPVFLSCRPVNMPPAVGRAKHFGWTGS